MKQPSRAYKTHPDVRQRERRMLFWALAVGAFAAALAGLIIYVASRGNGH